MRSLLQGGKLVGLGVIVVAGLTACNLFPEPAPQDIYRLPPSEVVATAAEPLELSLRIHRPSANELLNTTRIVVVPQGNRLNVYPNVRWSSPAPVLLRDHLLEAFGNDGRIARLSSGSERLQAELELGGKLRAFQVEYRAGVPEVVIRLDVHLVESTDKRIIASRRFAIREKAKGERIPAVVEAFGHASDVLATELIDWTLQQLNESRKG
ncbi:ABC-type transport auxiliary lipoprotein family protein [Thiohalophilus sp.]|uniref:ABC-type transport auxiliary lipoprotein family protein n=1 Tax=Thiohalophilus sp. TaxID=3028392 RepID=UPI002ACE49F8|nr:ABC-type transport auxiliary lipoprotein family protein [Thiohalophilus sp.]MDZ7805306.1 ABC-type transport auxiliary lipoprotein family protein [Thiohalophilus sp.]